MAWQHHMEIGAGGLKRRVVGWLAGWLGWLVGWMDEVNGWAGWAGLAGGMDGWAGGMGWDDCKKNRKKAKIKEIKTQKQTRCW